MAALLMLLASRASAARFSLKPRSRTIKAGKQPSAQDPSDSKDKAVGDINQNAENFGMDIMDFMDDIDCMDLMDCTEFMEFCGAGAAHNLRTV